VQSPKDSILSLEEQNQLLEKAIETADHILKVLEKYNLDENIINIQEKKKCQQ